MLASEGQAMTVQEDFIRKGNRVLYVEHFWLKGITRMAIRLTMPQGI
jgi:hypothetical protein